MHFCNTIINSNSVELLFSLTYLFSYQILGYGYDLLFFSDAI